MNVYSITEYLIWHCRNNYFIIYKREMVKGVGVESMQAKVSPKVAMLKSHHIFVGQTVLRHRQRSPLREEP
jgi:hypothetical protein